VVMLMVMVMVMVMMLPYEIPVAIALPKRRINSGASGCSGTAIMCNALKWRYSRVTTV
jgi:hypothetical protein